MMVSNHDRIGKLMRQLTEGLTPFVEAQLQIIYKGDWTDYARAEWRDGALGWDVSTLFGTMIEQWKPVFSPSLPVYDRNLVYELRDCRNNWAHQETFTPDDIERAFDNAERLLASIRSPLSATVRQQKMELRRIIQEEEQARLQNEQEAEMQVQREREQRRRLLETLLPVYLRDPQGKVIQAVLAVLQREQSLNKVTETEVTEYFERMLNSSINDNASKRETKLIRTQRTQLSSPVTPATLAQDSVEAHGIQRVREALEVAGYQAHLFERNVLRVEGGVTNTRTNPCFIRVISATEESFNIRDRYNDLADGLLAFVWYARSPAQAVIYAMTFEEAFDIAERKRWTLTDSWQIQGYYSTTRPDSALRDYLKPYAMTPDRWRAILSRENE